MRIKKLNKNKIERILYFLIIFSLLLKTNIIAKEIKIDLRGNDNNSKGLINRQIDIYKISNEIYDFNQREKIIPILNQKEDKDLEGTYEKIKGMTDGEGKAIINLEKGTYYAKVKDEEGKRKIYPFIFTVEENEINVIYPKGHDSSPGGKVKIYKISSSGKKLPNAEFKIYKREEGSLKDFGKIYITDEKGLIELGSLESGDYLLEEIKAPVGYQIKNKYTYFTAEKNKDLEIYIENYKINEGAKRFKKISEKKIPLKGAEFIITKKTEQGHQRIKKDGKDLVLKSEEDGYFIFDNMEYGTYYLWEIKAPYGYKPLEGNIKFEINKDSLKEDILIENKKDGEPVPKKEDEPKPKPKPEDKEKPKPKDEKKIKIKIPKTGDISLLILIIAGLSFIMLGKKILKDEEIKK